MAFYKDTRIKRLGPAVKLNTLQNKCFRSSTGAYEATNEIFLKAEAGVMPLDTYLDQTVLQSRNVPRCAEVTSRAKETIRRKICSKRGRRRQAETTPMDQKGMGQKLLTKSAANH